MLRVCKRAGTISSRWRPDVCLLVPANGPAIGTVPTMVAPAAPRQWRA